LLALCQIAASLNERNALLSTTAPMSIQVDRDPGTISTLGRDLPGGVRRSAKALPPAWRYCRRRSLRRDFAGHVYGISDVWIG
jgi:hypothetical protein